MNNCNYSFTLLENKDGKLTVVATTIEDENNKHFLFTLPDINEWESSDIVNEDDLE